VIRGFNEIIVLVMCQFVRFHLTGRPGLEPRMTEPESVVLPIKLSPNIASIIALASDHFKIKAFYAIYACIALIANCKRRFDSSLPRISIVSNVGVEMVCDVSATRNVPNNCPFLTPSSLAKALKASYCV
jgi:hypothetical protein